MNGEDADSDNTAPPPAEAERLWVPSRFRLFLSHVYQDRQRVSELQEALKQYAIDGWMAHVDIEFTREWESDILAALASCDALLAVLSSGFHASKWTDQEVGFCMGRRVLVASIQNEEAPYGFLGRYQAINAGTRPAPAIARAVFDALVKHDLTARMMAQALVAQFEESYSFQNAKDNARLLELVPRWTSDLLRRIDEAPGSNGQIRDATGVIGRVRRLVDSHSV
jgi:hypothetical protein